MRVLINLEDKRKLFEYLKKINNVNSLRNLAPNMNVSKSTLDSWRYSNKTYFPLKIIPEDLYKEITILDKKPDNWGNVKGGKKTYQLILKKYGKEDEGIISLRDFDYEKSSAYFDAERKFCWWNSKLYPMFGKYRKKKHIQAIAKSDRNYLEWILGSDFNVDIKQMVEKALNGEFPRVPDNL